MVDARADGEPWFEAYWTPSRPRRWLGGPSAISTGARVFRSAGPFEVGERKVFPWVRQVDVDGWLTDDRSKTYIAALPPDARDALLRKIEIVLRRAFPDGRMLVPYETWLWIATPTV